MKHNMAIALENPTSLALNVSAYWKLWNGEHQKALDEIDRAIALNPNDPDNFDTKAYIQVYTGPAKHIEENARHAMRLNPNYPADYLRILGIGMFHQERYSEAAELFERAAKREPDYEYNYPMLTAIYGHLGNLAGAEEVHQKFLELRSDQEGGAFTVQSISLWTPYAEKSHLLRYQQGLRLAGVPEGIVADDTEINYLDLVTKAEGEFSVEGVKKINLGEAVKMHEEGYVFIDNRSARGYGQGHIPGAVSLPFKSGLTRENLQDAVSKNAPSVFYCDGEGCYKSAHGVAKAITWGYTNVYYFAGGMPAWKKEGLPVEK
jgi:rhodanese-related sulfurtransferase